jgi:hypothetical protein
LEDCNNHRVATLRRFRARFYRQCSAPRRSRSSSRFLRDRRALPATNRSVAYDRPCRSFCCRRKSSTSSGLPSPASSERMPLSISARNQRSFSTCDNMTGSAKSGRGTPRIAQAKSGERIRYPAPRPSRSASSPHRGCARDAGRSPAPCGRLRVRACRRRCLAG